MVSHNEDVAQLSQGFSNALGQVNTSAPTSISPPPLQPSPESRPITPVTPSLGPASKVHILGPTAKPGRKPSTKSPSTDRQAQNRRSQRKFRDKKSEERKLLLQQVQLLQEENIRLKEENARVLAHNQHGKAKLEVLEQQMHDDRQSYEEALIRLQLEADHIREKQRLIYDYAG